MEQMEVCPNCHSKAIFVTEVCPVCRKSKLTGEIVRIAKESLPSSNMFAQLELAKRQSLVTTVPILAQKLSATPVIALTTPERMAFDVLAMAIEAERLRVRDKARQTSDFWTALKPQEVIRQMGEAGFDFESSRTLAHILCKDSGAAGVVGRGCGSIVSNIVGGFIAIIIAAIFGAIMKSCS